MEDALREAMSRGILRSDLEVEACFDTLAGATYYQLVVRGEAIRLPETPARLEAAFDTVWGHDGFSISPLPSWGTHISRLGFET